MIAGLPLVPLAPRPAHERPAQAGLFFLLRARCRAYTAVGGIPIGTPFSTYDINVPQLYANVDRVRAKQMGVALGDIHDTMQVNLGSLYVNDFTSFGKTYQVVV